MLEGDGGTRRNDRITEIWAYVAIDGDDNNEGIVGAMSAVGVVPLFAADKARVESYRPMAEEAARETGQKVKLVRFTEREEIEEIEPAGE